MERVVLAFVSVLGSKIYSSRAGGTCQRFPAVIVVVVVKAVVVVPVRQ